MQDIHELALIRVNALHLNIKDAVRVYREAIMLFDVFGQSFLAQVLDGAEFLKERFIIDVVIWRLYE